MRATRSAERCSGQALFCDTIHSLLPNAKIILISLLPRTDQSPNNSAGYSQTQWRAAVTGAASGRAWVSVLAGTDCYTTSDLAGDGLHPTQAGQNKLYTALHNAIIALWPTGVAAAITAGDVLTAKLAPDGLVGTRTDATASQVLSPADGGTPYGNPSSQTSGTLDTDTYYNNGYSAGETAGEASQYATDQAAVLAQVGYIVRPADGAPTILGQSGTYKVVAASNVLVGITFGAAAAQTGTLATGIPAPAGFANMCGVCYSSAGAVQSGIVVQLVQTGVPESGIVVSGVLTDTSDANGIVEITIPQQAAYIVRRESGPWITGTAPDATTGTLPPLVG
jgi:hypothetical protein